MCMADAVDRVDHAGGTDQRVAPAGHRGRPGMRFLTGHGDLVPALALRAGHDADRQPGGFEDRPLLDMRLEIGSDRAPADRPGSGKADAPQLAAKGQVGARCCRGWRARGRASKTPANTPDPTIAGENRDPSSLVQATISTGASVS